MTTTEALIAAIRAILAQSLDTAEFTELMPRMLSHLRSTYRRERKLFDDASIADLSRAAIASELVREFAELLEEKEFVESKSDAIRLIARFDLIAKQLVGCAFAGRASKEARELLERHQSLPDEAQIVRQRIEARPPRCLSCGGPTTLRESNFGLFWGCTNFPRCFGTAKLTAEQAASLQ